MLKYRTHLAIIKIKYITIFKWAVSSVEEQDLYTVKAKGSNPLPPTILIGHKCYGSIHDLGSCGVSSILTWPTILLGIWRNWQPHES